MSWSHTSEDEDILLSPLITLSLKVERKTNMLICLNICTKEMKMKLWRLPEYTNTNIRQLMSLVNTTEIVSTE